MTISTGSLKYT